MSPAQPWQCCQPRCSRYYGNSNAYNSNYYSQSRMLHDASNFLGDFDLLGLVTKGVELYKQLNEEEE